MDDTLTPEQLEEGRRRFANIGQPLGAVLFDYWLWKNFSAILTTAERAVAERDALRAEVERLRVALKPFADVADEYADQESDSFEVWKDAGPERLIRASFRLGLYRAARSVYRAALNGGKANG